MIEGKKGEGTDEPQQRDKCPAGHLGKPATIVISFTQGQDDKNEADKVPEKHGGVSVVGMC
ncbi:hypothetical protein Xoosp13_19 [Xanthomonas phage Xoo-sp13]|nr:hypothetical protein Xoosp13_19 [Xanthomonas phage Xoo-sp13]